VKALRRAEAATAASGQTVRAPRRPAEATEPVPVVDLWRAALRGEMARSGTRRRAAAIGGTEATGIVQVRTAVEAGGAGREDIRPPGMVVAALRVRAAARDARAGDRAAISQHLQTEAVPVCRAGIDPAGVAVVLTPGANGKCRPGGIRPVPSTAGPGTVIQVARPAVGTTGGPAPADRRAGSPSVAVKFPGAAGSRCAEVAEVRVPGPTDSRRVVAKV
jgi:hypothetical protein